MPLDVQRAVLDGRTADALGALVAERAVGDPDTGAVALAAWVSAEVRGVVDSVLLDDLATRLASGAALPTVDTSWALTAAVAALAVDASSPAAATVRSLARERLLGAQGPQGLPARLPRTRSGAGAPTSAASPTRSTRSRRSRVSPRRPATATGSRPPSGAPRGSASSRGPGQWWWHYDWRDGTVVEGIPSTPCTSTRWLRWPSSTWPRPAATDHARGRAAGCAGCDTHPEVLEELVSTAPRLVWRKVGRREPPKAARALSAAPPRSPGA